ncbi:MAG: hypothetical protein Q7S22_02260 [Candidatus Micrarchaeota archaeon]|nr:hypothetical protein [Candidatus Micrarchaeota archaeon]
MGSEYLNICVYPMMLVTGIFLLVITITKYGFISAIFLKFRKIIESNNYVKILFIVIVGYLLLGDFINETLNYPARFYPNLCDTFQFAFPIRLARTMDWSIPGYAERYSVRDCYYSVYVATNDTSFCNHVAQPYECVYITDHSPCRYDDAACLSYVAITKNNISMCTQGRRYRTKIDCMSTFLEKSQDIKSCNVFDESYSSYGALCGAVYTKNKARICNLIPSDESYEYRCYLV